MLTVGVVRVDKGAFGEPLVSEMEDETSRAMLRRLVLSCPARVSAGKVARPDLKILFTVLPLRVSSAFVPPTKPPFVWIGEVDVSVEVAAPALGMPGFNKKLFPDLSSYSSWPPDRMDDMISIRDQILRSLLVSDVSTDVASWINGANIKDGP